MARYYLTGWVGAGTALDPFRPDLVAPQWQAIDLRPDPTSSAGWCVVWTATPATSLPASAVDLGDGTFAALPNPVRNKIRSALGLSSLASATVPDILAELLTVHATTDGSRWRPLPRRDGRFELHLGELTRVWT